MMLYVRKHTQVWLLFFGTRVRSQSCGEWGHPPPPPPPACATFSQFYASIPKHLVFNRSISGGGALTPHFGRYVPRQSKKWGAPELAGAWKWGSQQLHVILDTLELLNFIGIRGVSGTRYYEKICTHCPWNWMDVWLAFWLAFWLAVSGDELYSITRNDLNWILKEILKTIVSEQQKCKICLATKMVMLWNEVYKRHSLANVPNDYVDSALISTCMLSTHLDKPLAHTRRTTNETAAQPLQPLHTYMYTTHSMLGLAHTQANNVGPHIANHLYAVSRDFNYEILFIWPITIVYEWNDRPHPLNWWSLQFTAAHVHTCKNLLANLSPISQ